MRKIALTGLVFAAAAGLLLPTGATAKTKAVKFSAPLKITPANAYGYEPGIISDKYGNLYTTAHKENYQLAAGPDSRETTQTRSMSWAWWSSDKGKTWKNLPTGPNGTDAFAHNFGDEGDMAADDSGYVYFVDTNVTDITFTAWHASGLGELTYDHHLPTVGFAEPVDDRPWVTAHGDGKVFYFGNEGNKSEYPAGQPPLGGGKGNANGPGRYTVYKSTDHGNTWDHTGYTLNDSGWCRPAADHAKGSKYVYAVCGNDKDQVYSYVSADDGASWNRYTIDSYLPATTDSYPSVEVAKDGSIWAVHVSKNDTTDDYSEYVKLYHSTDHGKHWKKQTITPKVGSYVYSWLSVSANGKKLGLATYFRAAKTDPWKIYGAVWTPGAKPKLVSIDSAHPAAPKEAATPPGDFLMSSFSKDGKLNVVWTHVVLRSPVADSDPSGQAPKTLQRDIMFARSL